MDETPLIVASIFVPVFFALVAITKIISDNRTKRKLVDAHVSEEVIHALFMKPRRDPELFSALKWGLVVAGVGLALVVIQVLPYEFNEPIAYGLMFLFAGAGLLAYYGIASAAANKDAAELHTRPLASSVQPSVRNG